MQQNISDLERLASVVTGGTLIALSARRPRRHLPGLALGTGLVARGVTGVCPVTGARRRLRARDDTRKALGGARGIRVEASVTIARPVEEVFARFRRLESLPNFMRAIERVDLNGERQSHWVMRAPAGLKVEWDAAIINDEPPTRLAWRSLPGADVASAGSVRFQPLPRGGTAVHVLLQYEPPFGKAGASMASLLGHSPAALLREDLRRFKQLMEAGEIPRADHRAGGTRTWLFNAIGARA
jgi:uncharacterized membrane protein